MSARQKDLVVVLQELKELVDHSIELSRSTAVLTIEKNLRRTLDFAEGKLMRAVDLNIDYGKELREEVERSR